MSRARTEKARSAARWIAVQACRRPPQEENGGATLRGDVEVLRDELIDAQLPRKVAGCVDRLVTVPQTDSGGQVENTKALGRTLVKELGKLIP